MNRILALVTAVLALAWTGVVFLLTQILAAGGAGIVRVSRWLSIDPARTQWLADTLDTVTTPVLVVVWIGWAVGMVALVAVARLLALTLSEVPPDTRLQERGRAQEWGRPRATVEGEVTGKRIRRR